MFYQLRIDHINWKKIFDQLDKNNIRTYDKIQRNGQEDDYTAGYLLDYPFSNEHYKLITIDLRKQQELDVDPKAIQLINITGNILWTEDAIIFLSLKKQKKSF